ncbi:MAG: type IX secretion system protein PorQ [Crocinitomicaceae bacterium]|nr:type IX secretion system protein PorQ [Crocinitomicaceae bacterium]
MKLYLFIYLLIFHSPLIAQIGGENSFNYLSRAYNSRGLALGNHFINIKDADVNLGVSNPSLLNTQMNNKWGFTQLFQGGDIQVGMIAMAKDWSKMNATYSTSLRYVNYGRMDETTITGEIIGKIHPMDFIVSTGFGKALNNQFRIGGQANLLYSQYARYAALGGTIDFAAYYENTDKNQSATVLIRNIGYQFISFLGKDKTSTPTEILMSFSHKLSHAPIRFTYLAHHLNRWDLTYNDPSIKGSIDPLTGDSILPKKSNTFQKVMHHFTPQIEILLSKNIHIRFAYDYHRRSELVVVNRPGLAGFSFGIGTYFKRFSLDYGFSGYSVAGSLHGVTLSTNFDLWRKKATSF